MEPERPRIFRSGGKATKDLLEMADNFLKVYNLIRLRVIAAPVSRKAVREFG